MRPFLRDRIAEAIGGGLGAEEVQDRQRREPEPDPRLLGMGADGAFEVEQEEAALHARGHRREPVGQGALGVPGVDEVAVGIDGAAPARQGRPATLAGLGEGPVGRAVLVIAIGVGGIQGIGRVRGWMGVAVHGGVRHLDAVGDRGGGGPELGGEGAVGNVVEDLGADGRPAAIPPACRPVLDHPVGDLAQVVGVGPGHLGRAGAELVVAGVGRG